VCSDWRRGSARSKPSSVQRNGETHIVFPPNTEAGFETACANTHLYCCGNVVATEELSIDRLEVGCGRLVSIRRYPVTNCRNRCRRLGL